MPPPSAIDLTGRTVAVGGRAIRWRHLIGADGAGLRRASRPRTPLPPGVLRSGIQRAGDSTGSRSGWSAIRSRSPTATSGSSRTRPTPRSARWPRSTSSRRRRCAATSTGAWTGSAWHARACPFEGATIEVEYHGCHFPGGVHLAGDAAGVVSSLTAEGIYAAIVTGEEVARRLLDPGCPAPKTSRWLRTKRRHDRLVALARPPRPSSLDTGCARPCRRAVPVCAGLSRTGFSGRDGPPRPVRLPPPEAGRDTGPLPTRATIWSPRGRSLIAHTTTSAPRGLPDAGDALPLDARNARSHRGGALVPRRDLRSEVGGQ